MSRVTLPGFANCHSHAFHRALRGHVQRDRGTFWSWREQMYDVAARLTPQNYYALARATYAEMLAAGYTSVGEFHYVHHQSDGTTYDDPNEMGLALIAAADDVGIRIRLLDSCYLAAGFGQPPEGVQARFSDGDADRWAERFEALIGAAGRDRVGAAIHSVRAVPPEQLVTVVQAAAGLPLHVHLSEQPAENDACLDATGKTPTRLLHDAGALGPDTTVVHATHLSDVDVALLGGAQVRACFCPTTERDLADGIGPAATLVEAGAVLTIGSDSHAVIDPFEEAAAVELNNRLASGVRGTFSAAELVRMGSQNGHNSLGIVDSGEVEIDGESIRTAGATSHEIEAAIFAATAADVRRVRIDGRVVFDGDSTAIAHNLSSSIGAVLS